MRSVSGIGVLDKAISILDAVESAGGDSMALAELMEITGLSRATAHRLAVALVAHGFLGRDSGARFALGPRMSAVDLPSLARPALEALRDTTGESVQLYVRRGDQRRCVASLESPHGLRTMVAVGALLPLGVGSAGKALVATTAGTDAGWVQSVEEREKGVASVSAPVYTGTPPGRVITAAVSVSGPIERTTRSPGERYGATVVAAARAVEQAISR